MRRALVHNTGGQKAEPIPTLEEVFPRQGIGASPWPGVSWLGVVSVTARFFTLI